MADITMFTKIFSRIEHHQETIVDMQTICSEKSDTSKNYIGRCSFTHSVLTRSHPHSLCISHMLRARCGQILYRPKESQQYGASVSKVGSDSAKSHKRDEAEFFAGRTTTHMAGGTQRKNIVMALRYGLEMWHASSQCHCCRWY